MLHKNRLFTPGPTPLLPAAQTAMAAFTAHHRTADFKQLFQRVLADMKEFVGRALLRNRVFCRNVVINQWFLRIAEQRLEFGPRPVQRELTAT